MEKNYTALIIDIKESRSYVREARSLIQSNIMDVLYELNYFYRDVIVREVEFSAGDEIQGLFASPEAAYLFYRMVALMMYPVELRAGIGVGGWDIRVENRGTTFQDGSAYHNARHAINCTDESEGYPVLFFSGSYFDITINTIISGTAAIMLGQSPYQNQIMLLTELLYPIDYMGATYDHRKLLNIVSLKNKISHDLDRGYNLKYTRGYRALPLDRLDYDAVMSIMPKVSDERYGEQEFYITSGRQWGISTKLSTVLKTSRQTIDKTLKAGNIFTARNMAINAIYEMRKMRWER